jgi:hypothetical protein
MGKLIRLAIAALVLYGCWQAGSAQWDFFRLREAVRELALFSAEEGEEALRTKIVAEAAKAGIRIDPARVSITSTGDRTQIDVAYTRSVRLLPWYRYEWSFAFKAESWRVPGGRLR